jgi:hypothetical protein
MNRASAAAGSDPKRRVSFNRLPCRKASADVGFAQVRSFSECDGGMPLKG